jgi:carboxyl-terminal processing protease
MNRRSCSALQVSLLAPLVAIVACVDPVMVTPPRDCSLVSQNGYVLEVMQRSYLWNTEVPAVDPAAYESPAALLADVRFREVDRWSRVADKVQSDALFEEGKFIGFGFSHRRDQDGRVRVSFVDGDSPASRAGLRRGDELVLINQRSIAEIDAGQLWGEMFGPTELGISLDLQVVGVTGELQDLALTKDWVSIVSVPVAEVVELDGRKIGYLVFSSFVEPGIDELDGAFKKLKAAGISELVIDMRYNGGGRLSVARHLASLIAGDAGKRREIVYRVVHNEDLSDANESYKLSRLDDAVNLSRVYFLTTGRTLSASELVINAVRPYVDTYVVGGATGGKPVGMRSFEFCDKILFPITFRLVNAAGETDYFDGLAPDCAAIDDLSHELGDPKEASLAAALTLIRDGSCEVDIDAGAPAPAPEELLLREDPWRALVGRW